jgi:hypothetical protein
MAALPGPSAPGRVRDKIFADAPSAGGLLRAQLFHQRQVIFNMPVGGNFTAADIVAGDRVVSHLHFHGRFTGTFGTRQGKGQNIDFMR